MGKFNTFCKRQVANRNRRYLIAASLIILLLRGAISYLQAQPSGVISGEVRNLRSHRPVRNALVRLLPGNLSQTTDTSGCFRFSGLPSGKYQLQTFHPNYYVNVVFNVLVREDSVTLVNIALLPGTGDAIAHMNLGGVIVTNDRHLLPSHPYTQYTIYEGEIEHFQANSLRDVIDLIPGIVRGSEDAPGLSRSARVALRNPGVRDPFALFGTQVIVDGFPLSNNANRQAGPGVGYGTKVLSTANTSIDLRKIAADNMFAVEVIPGVAPAEYGDFTEGLILVKTKKGRFPPRIKVKNNPDTREISFYGSRQLPGGNLDYFINYARSERDPRRSGDEFGRLTGHLRIQHNLSSQRAVSILHKFEFSKNFEEDQDRGDPYRTQAYNRDYSLAYNSAIKWEPKRNLTLESIQSFRFSRRKSFLSRLERADILPVSSNLEPGTSVPEDTIVGSYLSQVKTLGKEYTMFWKTRLRYSVQDRWGALHNVTLGIEANLDKNTGEGKIFDPLRPPGGSFSIKPYSFDQEPATSAISIFYQEQISGLLHKSLLLSVGFRHDFFQPEGLFHNGQLIYSSQGSFFNPRLGLLFKITPATQIRLNFGKAAKRPSLDMVFRQPYFRDMLDVGVVNGDTVQLVTTYRFSRKNSTLKGYQQTKFSAGIDQRLGDLGLSLTGYWQRSSKIPEEAISPVVLHHYFFPGFLENPLQRSVLDTLFINFPALNPYRNSGWTQKYGAEVSFISRRISPLNARIRISMAYDHFTSGSEQLKADPARIIRYSSPDGGELDGLMVYPLFTPIQSWHERLVLKYYVDFVSRYLGFWITLTAEHVPWQRELPVPENTETVARGFFSINGYHSLKPEEAQRLGLTRDFPSAAQRVISIRKDKWLFSAHLSKALGAKTELSLFVVNILNDPADYVSPYSGVRVFRNPEMFYGLELSAELDNLF